MSRQTFVIEVDYRAGRDDAVAWVNEIIGAAVFRLEDHNGVEDATLTVTESDCGSTQP